MKKLLVLGIACALAGGLATAAYAQSASNEIATAHAHALMAQSAKTVNDAHTHLHHVINCLVGPKGQGYDAAAGTPCKGQGSGAITDSANNAALNAKAKSALADAQAGLKASSLATAQSDAGKAAAALQATPTQQASGGYSW